MTHISNNPQTVTFDQQNQTVDTQLNAGGDIFYQVSYQVSESDFFTPSLESYQAQHIVRSPAIDQLADILCQRQLLILSGDHRVNTDSLARYTAWRLNTEVLPQKTGALNGCNALPIKEWKRSGVASLNIALREQQARTIFILPHVLPQHIDYNLQEFRQVIRECQHYVLVTVVGDEHWHTAVHSDILEHFWLKLLADDIYTSEYLTRVLGTQLSRSQKKLPQPFFQTAIKEHRIGEKRLCQVAQQLQTPENIADFVELLCEGTKQKRDLITATNEYITIAQEDDFHRLQRWYQRLQEPRERLLVLALHFFDGLPDDQFFAAVEILIEQAWLRREESLRSLDYCDFEPFTAHFFRYVQEKGGEAIKTYLPEQRSLLFQAAWKTHRRHILSALPVFVKLIKDSVAQEPLDWALYGSKDRCGRLRRALTDTISDIGLRDVGAVEITLLRLAIDSNSGVQVVAARAVARWNEHGETTHIFSLLNRWMYDKGTLRIIDSIIKAPDSMPGEKPESFLKMTVGFIIGYMSRSYPSDALPDELLEHLQHLVNEQNPAVLKKLCHPVLLLMLPLHFRQIKHLIICLARNPELHPAIAESFVQFYRQKPYVVCKVLDRWYHFYLHSMRQTEEGSDHVLDEDERVTMLACTSAIYGRLPLTDTHKVHPLTVEDVFQRMQKILIEEQHPLVRKTAMKAVIRQGNTYFIQLKGVIPYISPEERNEILDTLVEIYLNQRRSLPGGDTYLPDQSGELYPVWRRQGQRPLTAIEQEMANWSMKESQNPIIQQLACQALVKFRIRIDEDKLRRSEQLENTTLSLDVVLPPMSPRMTGLHPFDPYIYYVVPWMVTIDAPHYRNIIRGVLPEVRVQQASSPSIMATLLYDFNYLPDHDIVEVTRRLQRAMHIAVQRNLLIGASLCILVLLGIVLFLVARMRASMAL